MKIQISGIHRIGILLKSAMDLKWIWKFLLTVLDILFLHSATLVYHTLTFVSNIYVLVTLTIKLDGYS